MYSTIRFGTASKATPRGRRLYCAGVGYLVTSSPFSRSMIMSMVSSVMQYWAALLQMILPSSCRPFSEGEFGPNMQTARIAKAFPNGCNLPITGSSRVFSGSRYLVPYCIVSSFLKDSRFDLDFWPLEYRSISASISASIPSTASSGSFHKLLKTGHVTGPCVAARCAFFHNLYSGFCIF